MKRPDPQTITSRQFELIVIGGGINGAAIARDAALRGLSVLLLEKSDFASGTTSFSTRLIHGGLRYLEYGEVGLVRESLREREGLIRHARHLVSPLPLYLPIYRRSRRGPLTIRAGMTAYDALSFDKSLPGHQMLDPTETLAAVPGLDPDDLLGAAMYYDAQVTFPERLVIENLLDATALSAVAVNYAQVEQIVVEGGSVVGVRFTDVLSGENHEVTGRSVLNVTGPWVDEMLSTGGASSGNRPLMGGTKGTHCFLPAPNGPAIPALYSEARSDGRAFFVLPWNDMMMIGTTDTRFDGDLDHVVATPDELAYLVAEARILLPDAAIDPTSIAFAYAGVRPLPNTSQGAEAGITRRHFVVHHAPGATGLFSVVGGKLTNHRSLAEHAVDEICRFLGLGIPGSTVDKPLPGSGLVTSPATIPNGLRHRLAGLYGKRSERIFGLGLCSPALVHPLVDSSDAVPAELIMAFDDEAATSLSDALLRRMMTAWRPGMGRDVAMAAAAFCQTQFGWTPARVEHELAGYEAAVRSFEPV